MFVFCSPPGLQKTFDNQEFQKTVIDWEYILLSVHGDDLK